MNLADLSIRRPVFISSVVFLMLVAGLMFMRSLPVDLFPNVTFPVVVVTVPYKGAGPAEVETLVAKPLEDEMSTISGVKRLSSISQEGAGTLIAEFTLETDIKVAESRIRDAVSAAKRKLPNDTEEPIIRRVDPADQPILILSVKADLGAAELFDLANEEIRPRIEQVNQVGLVEVIGGRRREIQVLLDRNKLKDREISASLVSNRLSSAGENVPVGKVSDVKAETVFRTVAQFKSIEDIKTVVLNFFGNDRSITIADVGTVSDTLRDERSRVYVNGDSSLFIYVFRQSGSNTVSVVDSVKRKVDEINQGLSKTPGNGNVSIVRDGSLWIRANLADVRESILIGIVLAVVVVFLFLANGRSTIITALALPNSLIGAFILMAFAGFSINIMTLLALSLSVGLLIDDAIVVRENIYRHLEMGKSALKAALDGTGEVRLAVIATTFTVIAVFGPVGFLQGVVGQFFKEFGLTVCFAMLISLFDALTIAPMLSAYFAGSAHSKNESFLQRRILRPFDRFQSRMEDSYGRFLNVVLEHPLKSLAASGAIFILSIAALTKVPKTFLPPQDAGEFAVGINLNPGASLDRMDAVAREVDQVIRSNKEVLVSALTVGGREGDSSAAEFYVRLIPFRDRSINTSQFKERLREQLKKFSEANPQVKDYDPIGAGQRPFIVNIRGSDQAQLEVFAGRLLEKLKDYPKLKDVDVNFRAGKPEFQVEFNKNRAEQLGVSTFLAGLELRTLVDGSTPGKFRQNGREYDIRVRLKEDQRDLKKAFSSTFVPNINQSLVPLRNISAPVDATGPNKIFRQDRTRYVQLNADITPGAGLGEIMTEVSAMIEKDLQLPSQMNYAYVGQAENFKELGTSMLTAIGLGIIFIYLVLASLYESFVIPFTIMLALPLAIAGSFFALLLTGQSLNIFSWIGIIMLLGVSTKNSILLVDFAHQKVQEGWDRSRALIEAGRTRLRPILMTTMALIAGTIPIAIGLNEASRQRTSMGIAIIGGLISSTVLTLIVIPAAYSFIDRFRVWSMNILRNWAGTPTPES